MANSITEQILSVSLSFNLTCLWQKGFLKGLKRTRQTSRLIPVDLLHVLYSFAIVEKGENTLWGIVYQLINFSVFVLRRVECLKKRRKKIGNDRLQVYNRSISVRDSANTSPLFFITWCGYIALNDLSFIGP